MKIENMKSKTATSRQIEILVLMAGQDLVSLPFKDYEDGTIRDGYDLGLWSYCVCGRVAVVVPKHRRDDGEVAWNWAKMHTPENPSKAKGYRYEN